MRFQKNMSNYFSSTRSLRYLLTQAACWLLIWSQFLLVSGLVGIPITANVFAVVLFGELLLILALRTLISTNVARDFLDLSFYSLMYIFATMISYYMKLELYVALVKNWNLLATFFFVVTNIRIFWAVKVQNSETYYAWPIIGPVSWLMATKSEEPVVRTLWHSILIYGILLTVFAGTVYGGRLEYSDHVKQAFAGLIGFILFFRAVRPYMQGNLALVDENIQYRTSEEKLASLIMTVQTQAGGKLNPELVKTMCHFAQLDDRTQLILAATIADVAKAIMVPANQPTYDDEPPKDR